MNTDIEVNIQFLLSLDQDISADQEQYNLHF